MLTSGSFLSLSVPLFGPLGRSLYSPPAPEPVQQRNTHTSISENDLGNLIYVLLHVSEQELNSPFDSSCLAASYIVTKKIQMVSNLQSKYETQI